MKTRKKLMLVVTLIFVMSFVLGNVAYAYAINNKALNTSYAQVAPNQMKTATTSTMHVSRFVGDSQTIWRAKLTDAAGTTLSSAERRGTGTVNLPGGTITQTVQLHMKKDRAGSYTITGTWTP